MAQEAQPRPQSDLSSKSASTRPSTTISSRPSRTTSRRSFRQTTPRERRWTRSSTTSPKTLLRKESTRLRPSTSSKSPRSTTPSRKFGKSTRASRVFPIPQSRSPMQHRRPMDSPSSRINRARRSKRSLRSRTSKKKLGQRRSAKFSSSSTKDWGASRYPERMKRPSDSTRTWRKTLQKKFKTLFHLGSSHGVENSTFDRLVCLLATHLCGHYDFHVCLTDLFPEFGVQ